MSKIVTRARKLFEQSNQVQAHAEPVRNHNQKASSTNSCCLLRSSQNLVFIRRIQSQTMELEGNNLEITIPAIIEVY